MASERDFVRKGLQRRSDCPPLEILERLLTATDPALAAHVRECAHCNSELQMLDSFHRADVPANDVQAVEKIITHLRQRPVRIPVIAGNRLPWRQRMGGWLRPATLVAAVVLVLAAIGLQLRHSGPPALRQETGADVMRSNTLQILAPLGDLADAPKEARWEAVPSAANYRIRLLEVDGHEVWSAQTAANMMEFPTAVRAQMVPSKTLAITVSAFDTGGKKLAESENSRFRILQKLYPR